MISLLKKTLICCFAFVAMVSCDDKPVYEKPDIPETDNPNAPDATRLLILSQGNMGGGTASLTLIRNNNLVSQDVFRSINSRPLGDVAQSLAEIGDNYYVTLQLSHKIEVFNKKTFKSVETIFMPGASTPCYIADIGNGKIAITEQRMDGALVVANALGNTKETVHQVIEGVGPATHMKVLENKLFIGGSSLRVFDLNNGSLSNFRHVKDSKGSPIGSFADSKIVVDKNGNLWMLHGGFDDNYDYVFRLICVDPKKAEVIKDYQIMGGLYFSNVGARLDIAPNGEDIYFTGRNSHFGNIEGIVKFNINDEVGPDKMHFEYPKEIRTLYCMSISYEGTIFICDAEFGTLNRGAVFEMSTEGELINKFETGLFPGYIHFIKK